MPIPQTKKAVKSRRMMLGSGATAPTKLASRKVDSRAMMDGMSIQVFDSGVQVREFEGMEVWQWTIENGQLRIDN